MLLEEWGNNEGVKDSHFCMQNFALPSRRPPPFSLIYDIRVLFRAFSTSQKPVSSVSPIYQTSSTRIQPVQPQIIGSISVVSKLRNRSPLVRIRETNERFIRTESKSSESAPIPRLASNVSNEFGSVHKHVPNGELQRKRREHQRYFETGASTETRSAGQNHSSTTSSPERVPHTVRRSKRK